MKKANHTIMRMIIYVILAIIPLSPLVGQEVNQNNEISKRFNLKHMETKDINSAIPFKKYIISVTSRSNYKNSLLLTDLSSENGGSTGIRSFSMRTLALFPDLIDPIGNKKVIFEIYSPNKWGAKMGLKKEEFNYSIDYTTNISIYDIKNDSIKNITKNSGQDDVTWDAFQWLPEKNKILCRRSDDTHLIKWYRVANENSWEPYLLSLDGTFQKIKESNKELMRLYHLHSTEWATVEKKRIENENKIEWDISFGKYLNDQYVREYKKSKTVQEVLEGKNVEQARRYIVNENHIIIRHPHIGSFWGDLKANKIEKIFDSEVLGINRELKTVVVRKGKKMYKVDMSNYEKWPD